MKRYEASGIYQMLEIAGFDQVQITLTSDKHREFMLITGRKSTSVLLESHVHTS